jgi:protein-S-isoprenylcysteine O-methyltransferase Ste14
MNFFRHPWNLVFLAGFIVYIGIRNAYIKRTKENEKTVKHIDWLEKVLMVIVSIGNLLLPVLYLFTPLLAIADYRLPAIAGWIGSVVMVTALWMFWRSHADLGLNWSMTLEMRKGHKLVRHGIYRFIRHPMYASIWLFGIAQALLLQNWIAGFSALVTFAPLYFVRTPREEQMMRTGFGTEYMDYMRRTGRVFPRFR